MLDIEWVIRYVPIFISVIVVSSYGIAWLVYLKYSQTDFRRISVACFLLPRLPLSPIRVWKINIAFFSHIRFILFGPALRILLQHWKLRIQEKNYQRIHFDINYGVQKNNVLDVYFAGRQIHQQQQQIDASVSDKPVIIFVFGGSWNSGDKQIYSLLGSRLRSCGYVVVIPNYTLYPDGKITEMTNDIRQVVLWTYTNIKDYGGDPSKIFLMGHSAGAHLCSLTVVQSTLTLLESRSQTSARPNKSDNNTTLLPDESRTNIANTFASDEELYQMEPLPNICGLVLVAGVFDIFAHFHFESKRGVEEISPMARVMGNSPDGFSSSSPVIILQKIRNSLTIDYLREYLPPNVLLIHGEKILGCKIANSSVLIANSAITLVQSLN
ncbi:hypothetical protein HK096_009311 [Nowakowskiella sp. JEL0078]|nr:hypothetical protein HK096_009311 [Nowakowskiella sp. JEL0078]